MYGKNNTGPAREVWKRGDRVCLASDTAVKGKVASPRRDPRAFETECVWVEWDDGEYGYIDPNSIDLE